MYEQNRALMCYYYICMSRDFKNKTERLLLILLLVNNKTHARMHARTHTHTLSGSFSLTHTHTQHTPHVLMDAHTLAHMLSCVDHFQELSVNQGVNVEEFVWSIQNKCFSVNVFYNHLCVSKAKISIQWLLPAGTNCQCCYQNSNVHYIIITASYKWKCFGTNMKKQ